MKVLFTSHWYPSKKNNMGAFIQKYYQLISAHTNADLLTINIHNSNRFFKKSINRISDSHTEIEVESRFWKFIYLIYPLQQILLWKSIVKITKKENYKLIHANVMHPNGVMVEYLSRKLKIPFVLSEHHSQFSRYAQKFITRNRIERTLNKVSYVLPVSEKLKNNIDKISPGIEQQIIPNIISNQDFRPLGYKSENKTLTLCAIGSWNDGSYNTKLPYLIVDALKIYCEQKNIKAILNHCGDCSIQSKLQERAGDKITLNFNGFLNPKEINEVLNASDYFVHATKFETFCVVAIEAQMAGKAVILSNIDPIPEISTEEGRVLAKNTIENWIQAFYDIEKLNIDSNAISQKAQKMHDVEDVWKRIDAVYNELLHP